MPDIDTMYVGFESSGLFRQFPGQYNSNLDNNFKKRVYDPRVRGWYKDAKSAARQKRKESPKGALVEQKQFGESIVTAPYLGASSGKWMITIAKAVYDPADTSRLYAVVGFDITIDKIQSDIINIHFLKSGYVALVESKARGGDSMKRYLSLL